MGAEHPDTVTHVFTQATKAVRSNARDELADVGLHLGQDLLLLQLYEEDGCPQGELADHLNVDPSAISKMLSRMESAGLVERQSDTDDSRITRVFLTEKGCALQESVEDIHHRIESQMLVGFSTEEKHLFRRMLVDVRDNLS